MRKAKSRLKKTKEKRKLLKKLFRVIPVKYMGETIDYIYLERK